MRQNVLRVLKSFYHLQVRRLHSRVERIGASFSALIHIGHNLGLRAQHNLGVILEVNLDNFVGKTEHDGMPRAHPFLNVNNILYATLSALDLFRHLSVGVGLFSAFKIAAEVLEQSHFLL